MRAFAVNGQTATTKGFSGVFYRATALLAGFDSGTFLTEAALAIGGFRVGCFHNVASCECHTVSDFDSRWTGGGSNVVHPNYRVSRMVPVVKIPRETARVLRWAALDGETVTNAHRADVARLAKERHGKAKAFARTYGDHGAALLAMTSDSEAIALAVSALRSPEASPERKAWERAMQAAKIDAFRTI